MAENDIGNVNNESELEPEQKRKLFIGSLSYSIDENVFRDYWAQFGTVLNAMILRDRDGHSRGFGFVTFDNSASVDAVMKARPHTLDNRVVEPKRAVPREASSKPDTQLAVKKLYVGGVKEPIVENDLRDYFSKYGTIVNATVTKDRDGQYRGYGFIEFDDYDPVDKIIIEKNHFLCGLQLDVQKAQSKDNSQRGGGGNMRFRQGPPPMGRSNYGGGGGGGGGGYNNRQQNTFDGPYGRQPNYNDYNSNFNQGDNNRASFGQGYNQESAGGPMRRGNMRGGGRGFSPYNGRGGGRGGGGGDQGPSWSSWD